MNDSGWPYDPLQPDPPWTEALNDAVINTMMESCWTGNEEHDNALQRAAYTTGGLSNLFAVLAAECSTETDERMPTTISIVRRCEEACRTAMVELARWETIDPGALRAAVESCIVACEETYTDFQRYLPELYPGPGAHRHELYDTVHRMRKTMSVVPDCIVACKEFLEVWFGAEVPK